MGSSGSKVARGDVEMSTLPARAPERRHSLPARAASALGSLSFCRGRHDSVHVYTPLPLGEGTLRVGADDGATASVGGKRGLVTALEDTASATSSTVYWPASASATSSTAQWPVSPGGFRGEPSSSAPVQFLAPEFDPAVLSLFRDTMTGPSPSHPALLFPEREGTSTTGVEEPFTRDIPEVMPEFHEQRMVRDVEAYEEEVRDYEEDVVEAPRARNGVVVVYFTSLRGVRKTFEDGRAVHAILGAYGVRVDERDVSMHAAFKDELRGLLDGGLALPRVFVVGDGGQQQNWQWHDLGGADDVRAQHETGELARVLEGCEPLGPNHAPCLACGGMRFQPCYTCYGSCRVYAGDEGGYLAGTFQDCPDCNENGLIRCPFCCY
jgi:glutaredoxin domain-containing cysteine-rich protein 1